MKENRYPEQIDGLCRHAELYEARGELQKAADYYHQTADFAEKAEGFGKESADFFRKKATQLAACRSGKLSVYRTVSSKPAVG